MLSMWKESEDILGSFALLLSLKIPAYSENRRYFSAWFFCTFLILQDRNSYRNISAVRQSIESRVSAISALPTRSETSRLIPCLHKHASIAARSSHPLLSLLRTNAQCSFPCTPTCTPPNGVTSQSYLHPECNDDSGCQKRLGWVYWNSEECIQLKIGFRVQW